MIPVRLALLGLGLALLGGPLRAEPGMYGGQLTLAKPLGDLEGGPWLKGRAAVGGGLHYVLPVDGGNAFRPRVDLTIIPKGQVNLVASDGSVMDYAERAKVRILDAGLDWNFFLNNNHFEGAYWILGLGYAWAQFTGTELTPGAGVGDPAVPWPTRQISRSLSYNLGMGWRFRPHLGAEFRFTQGSFFDLAPGGLLVKAPMLNLSLTLDNL